MVVAGVVIHTYPGAAPKVALRLQGIPGLTIHAGDGSSRIAAVWSADSAAALETMAENLVSSADDIVGVFPTFVGED
jgi:nitrate reductase NapAB chaperone NapD